jgi:acylphosphatase
MKTIEILINGRVQKVGFRACIRRIASDLNVAGTVVNLADGRVRICAYGEAILLEKFLSMIYSCPRAIVREVRVVEIPFKEYFGFSIIKNDDNINIES